ncbi:gamma-glutamylcyclotransferase 2-3 isoform X2 [Mangifera indica]|uniref:gamma-glutamylcyclotransferase 2-3 isoform X2 n=1 Tax=Mangifera indica TaxID=29780 RepID=UPI001CFB5377|nr:gamma-glutamylcyclotransferase 2-3 isoform X2 [Mangifera indica]
MAMWVFGYGSLIWKVGFNYDDRVVGFIKGYRRVFYQGSTDHRGTPENPGRTVTLEPADGEICWGAAYKISKEEDKENAINHLEVREKQYDQKAYVDFFTDPTATTPAVSGVMLQIVQAEGPSGPNRDYLFQLEKALLEFGCKDEHVINIANEVRRIVSELEQLSTQSKS